MRDNAEIRRLLKHLVETRGVSVVALAKSLPSVRDWQGRRRELQFFLNHTDAYLGENQQAQWSRWLDRVQLGTLRYVHKRYWSSQLRANYSVGLFDAGEPFRKDPRRARVGVRFEKGSPVLEVNGKLRSFTSAGQSRILRS